MTIFRNPKTTLDLEYKLEGLNIFSTEIVYELGVDGSVRLNTNTFTTLVRN